MRTQIRFLLNGAPQLVGAISPTTTLMQWLRRDKKLTGTKEGCAEGDCGACTVVVGRCGPDGRMAYDAINACIAFLPTLEGTSVTTVEGVAGRDGRLHPCQQAIVDCHGSQCGFCTPGFVMSLYALYQAHDGPPSDIALDDALAGNLCRCTGYGPIVAAARAMFAVPRPDDEAARRERERAELATLRHSDSLHITGAGREMFLPATEDDLARLAMAHPSATLVAGATDVGLWVTKQDRALPVTISVGRVSGFAASREIERAGETRLWLGAGMTHARAADVVGERSPDLAELWRRFAGRQVRNAGTVGGNIANGSPIGDLAPALIALGAVLHLRRGDERRTMPLEDFFLAYGKQDRQPGEFVTGIDIPASAEALGGLACHKVSKRFDDDISSVCGAFAIGVAGDLIATARIAFGGMAATPKRARAVEAALMGKPWGRATIDAALPAFAADFTPISDARASTAYRLRIAENLLVRTYLERSTPNVATRIAGGAALRFEATSTG